MSDVDITARIQQLFERSGSSQYGGEAVTQLEHALQAATLAEADGADARLITAALVHDIGHLLHAFPEDAPTHGVDDVHEELGYEWLRRYFTPEVTEPVRMHVAAKRYLCSVDPEYKDALSGPSLHSMELQGGALSDTEARAFEERPFFAEGVRLRRWDDLAKVASLPTPPLAHFLPYIERSKR
jgi:phosphonate degradation associated HDIG domain protein